MKTALSTFKFSGVSHGQMRWVSVLVGAILSALMLLYWSSTIEFVFLCLYSGLVLVSEALDADQCGETAMMVLSHAVIIGTVLFVIFAVRWVIVTILPLLS